MADKYTNANVTLREAVDDLCDRYGDANFLDIFQVRLERKNDSWKYKRIIKNLEKSVNELLAIDTGGNYIKHLCPGNSAEAENDEFFPSEQQPPNQYPKDRQNPESA